MNLTEDDIDTCQKAFADLDEDGLGAIKTSDLAQALDKIGIMLPERELYKQIYEVDETNTDDDDDLLDAFVAMGGQEDASGHVDAKKLIQTIKEEFEMTIDIEKLIDDIDKDGNGEIEYEEFKLLLKSHYID